MNAIAEQRVSRNESLGSIAEIVGELDTLTGLLAEIGMDVWAADFDTCYGVVEVGFLSAAAFGQFVKLVAEDDSADDLRSRVLGEGPAFENDDWRYRVQRFEEEASDDQSDESNLDEDDGNQLVFSVAFSVYDLLLVMKRVRRANEECWKQGG